MPGELLKRVIERASDHLAGDVYQRTLLDRHAAQGQLALYGAVPTWEEIASRAVEEAILSRDEATAFLDEVRDIRSAKIAILRRGARKKAGSRQDVDRVDVPREGAPNDTSENPSSE
jgi:hypothetical protein